MKKSTLILYILLVSACIDPYNFELNQFESLVIVEGIITTAPGPHQIKLSRSALYGNNFEGVVQAIPNASLHIRDMNGSIEVLHSTDVIGLYQTSPEFSAQVGNIYTLHIELQDGRTLMSLPEPALKVPDLDSLSVRTDEFFTENPLLNKSGAQVMAHFKDPADEKNYYQWIYGESVYALVTNPEEFRKGPLGMIDGRPCPYCPCPKDCCNLCYRTETLGRAPISLLDDEPINGNSISHPVLFIEDDGVRLRHTYRIDITQRSLSERAYRYLLLSKQQLEIEGSVFDPPPANIRSNIVQLDNPDIPVLGYFFASDVRTKRIYIKRDDLTVHARPNIIPDDCREVRDASLDAPDDWNPN